MTTEENKIKILDERLKGRVDKLLKGLRADSKLKAHQKHGVKRLESIEKKFENKDIPNEKAVKMLADLLEEEWLRPVQKQYTELLKGS